MLIKNVKVFTKDKSFKITDIATAGVRIAECSGDEQVLVDEVEATHIGCEYGE